MSNLQEAFKNLSNVNEIANKNLDEIPLKTRSSWATAKEDAKVRAKSLASVYKAALFENAVAIFLEGDSANAAKFAQLAQEAGEALVVDVEAMYRRIANFIEPTFGQSREYRVHQHDHLLAVVRDIMNEVDIRSIPPLPYKDSLSLATAQDVVNYVRNALRDSAGDLLNIAYVEKAVTEKAYNAKVTDTVVPVILLNASAGEVSAFTKAFGKGGVTHNIEATDEIDKEYLTKAFKEAQKKLKNKK